MLALQLLVTGLVTGCALGVVAISFSLVYATTKIFHVAHAGIYTLAGYLAWSLSKHGVPDVFALLLAMAGVYGVMAYLVSQRVREIGIRLALGATRQQVFALVFGRGLWMVGAGLLAGSAAALLAVRWIQSFLFGVTTHDPLTYVLVGAVVLFASAVAVFVPARRAASIEPMEALRTE